ncbi:craniofacial development protein 2-like [Sitophilus oryzae]|uniref:Craniofacial development protein 2-like n=1 Tax=Sitophilus oryzae TaxID=7048 RepID=A0A6J2YGE7_SITOR|nr:craniofacial development protein 2-like [Sitophilus oryzae]
MWTGSGRIHSMDKIFYYSGNNTGTHSNGVGILVDESLSNSVCNFVPVSDRCMMIQIEGTPLNVNIIQTYAPTSESSEEELERWYDELEQVYKLTKQHDINIIMGDMNAKVGEGPINNIVGKYGLGVRNERGERLIEFCQDHNMTITNTLFKLPKRRLYTWRSPQDNGIRIVRNQIDFILINQRFRSSVKSAKTFPGADINSDHNPVVANIKLKLKFTGKNIRIKNRHQDVEKRRRKIKQSSPEVNDALQEVRNSEEDINTTWNALKTPLVKATQTHLTGLKTKKKQRMTDEILQLMDQRREHKSRDTIAYKRCNKEINKAIITAKEKWISEKCVELEDLQKKHDSFTLHKKIKELTGPAQRFCPLTIINSDGTLCSNVQEKI